MKQIWTVAVLGLFGVVSQARATLILQCQILSDGRAVKTCHLRLTDQTDDSGAVRLTAGQVFLLSQRSDCAPEGNYDFRIENISQVRTLRAGASHMDSLLYAAQMKMTPAKFKMEIITYKNSARTKFKVRNGNTYPDASYMQISGNLSYSMNDTGIACSIRN